MTDPVLANIERGVFANPWHGPGWTDLLVGITDEQAVAKPAFGVHTIGEIVLHVAIWMELAKQAVDGHAMPPDDFNDWISMTMTWAQAKARFEKAARDLVACSVDLEATVPGRHHDFEHLLDGVAQHNAYHGGQVALLKKSFVA